MKFFVIVSSLNFLVLVSCISTKDYPNSCLDSKYHKKTPSPEPKLHGECEPWKDHACCTRDTALIIDEMKPYNFNFHHCAVKRPMSAECQKYFKRDLCFYECEPNLSPWTVQINSMKIRKERFYKVPLCASECDKWFEACKDDFTCAKNWVKDFKWTNSNVCDKECITFEKMYGSSQNFCQLIWDDSWSYTPDDQPCMRLNFNSSNGNPNEAVLKNKISPALSGQILKWFYIVLALIFIVSLLTYLLVRRIKKRNRLVRFT